MSNFSDRRRFVMQTGCGLLGAAAGLSMSQPTFAQDYDRRDPKPEYNVIQTKPLNPTLVKRWDTKNGELQPQQAVLDPDNPFSNSPSYLFEFREPGERLIASWSNPKGMRPGAYHVYTVAKAQRLGGPVGVDLIYKYGEHGQFSEQGLLESRKSSFDWRTFVSEFSDATMLDYPLLGIDMVLNAQFSGRVWIGAIEIVNLGLPERHQLFRQDPYGPGN
tara:strand:- start:266 stop:919 length:654 start_codon:yes stop_codon:yes gene_type:complete